MTIETKYNIGDEDLTNEYNRTAMSITPKKLFVKVRSLAKTKKKNKYKGLERALFYLLRYNRFKYI